MNMDNQKFEDEKKQVTPGQPDEANNVKPADDEENIPNNDHNPTIPRQGKGVQGMNMESGQNLYCENPNEKK